MTLQEQWFSATEHKPFTLPGQRGSALLIHGFMGTPREMRPLAHALNECGFRTIVPLLPGFGEQIATINDVGRTAWVGTARGFWESLYDAGDGDILVGYSMGGSIAMELACERPPRKLILLAPLWRMMGGNWSVTLLPVLKHVIRRARPFARTDFDDPKVRNFLAMAIPGIDLDDPGVRESLRNDAAISTSTLDELRRLSRAAGDLASQITSETLVVQGISDYTVRARDTRALFARMGPNAHLIEVETGHLLLAPDSPTWPEVRDSILEFIDGFIR